MKVCVRPIRLLTAVPLCDGHDSAVTAVNQALIEAGFEVIYMGYHRSAEAIVRAAVQEDVAGVGISSYNGGHIEFFREVVEGLRAAGREDIGVFGGGGGTITAADTALMQQQGTDVLFMAGTSFEDILRRLDGLYAERELLSLGAVGDSQLGRTLTAVEAGWMPRLEPGERGKAKIIGLTGPGGAGKTTLIDEWIRAALVAQPSLRIAVLSHDPSSMSRGGLLGDRATMVYSQHERVFIRSMATRGQQGGLSPASGECLRWLASKQAGFDLVFVETVGTGQEALPFDDGLVDVKLVVLHPEYGARLQLQKILMLDVADAVVMNKCDWLGAQRAVHELEAMLLRRQVPIFETRANEHADSGVERLRKHFQLESEVVGECAR